MKFLKTAKIASAFSVFLSLVLSPLSANSFQIKYESIYYGAGLGQFFVKGGEGTFEGCDETYTPNLPGKSETTNRNHVDCEGKSLAGKIFIGMQFNPYLAVETGIFAPSTMEFTYDKSGNNQKKLETKHLSLFGSMVTKLPIGDKFELFIKGGGHVYRQLYRGVRAP